MTSGTVLWYLTRGSGVVALLLLTATTLLGVLTAGRWRSERWPRFAVAALHRNLTLVALVFIGIHVGTTIADGYAPIGIKDIFVPFTSQYRPVWLGFGALTLDLLLAIGISSALRKHIGYRAWRVLHWSAYATWPLALAHGLGSGSDARYGWMAYLSIACLLTVVVSIAVRLYQSRSPALQVLAGATALGLVVLLGSWYAGGPGQRGWAARAGTPKSLLSSSARAAVSSRQLASVRVVEPVTRFSGRLAGHMSSSGPDQYGNAAVAVAMAVRGGNPGLVKFTLWGSAIEGGGIHMAKSDVSFEDARTGTVYNGAVVGLQGNLVVADVTSSGSTLRLTMQLRIDGATQSVTGTVKSVPVGEGAGTG